MNLFMWLSQFGLTGELFGERLVPIGSVYDPFIARGLDALIYALYVKSRFVLVGTPSGVTLAPEGGAHQSTVTPSLGIELPGLRGYEPVFAREVEWTLLEGHPRLPRRRTTGSRRTCASRPARSTSRWRPGRGAARARWLARRRAGRRLPAARGDRGARAAAAGQPGRPGRGGRRDRARGRRRGPDPPSRGDRGEPHRRHAPPSGWPPGSTAAGSMPCAAAGATTSGTSGR